MANVLQLDTSEDTYDSFLIDALKCINDSSSKYYKEQSTKLIGNMQDSIDRICDGDVSAINDLISDVSSLEDMCDYLNAHDKLIDTLNERYKNILQFISDYISTSKEDILEKIRDEISEIEKINNKIIQSDDFGFSTSDIEDDALKDFEEDPNKQARLDEKTKDLITNLTKFNYSKLDKLYVELYKAIEKKNLKEISKTRGRIISYLKKHDRKIKKKKEEINGLVEIKEIVDAKLNNNDKMDAINAILARKENAIFRDYFAESLSSYYMFKRSYDNLCAQIEYKKIVLYGKALKEELREHKEILSKRYDTEFLDKKMNIKSFTTALPKALGISIKEVANSIGEVKEATTGRKKKAKIKEVVKNVGKVIVTPGVFGFKLVADNWYTLYLLSKGVLNINKKQPKAAKNKEEKVEKEEDDHLDKSVEPSDLKTILNKKGSFDMAKLRQFQTSQSANNGITNKESIRPVAIVDSGEAVSTKGNNGGNTEVLGVPPVENPSVVKENPNGFSARHPGLKPNLPDDKNFRLARPDENDFRVNRVASIEDGENLSVVKENPNGFSARHPGLKPNLPDDKTPRFVKDDEQRPKTEIKISPTVVDPVEVDDSLDRSLAFTKFQEEYSGFSDAQIDRVLDLMKSEGIDYKEFIDSDDSAFLENFDELKSYVEAIYDNKHGFHSTLDRDELFDMTCDAVVENGSVEAALNRLMTVDSATNRYVEKYNAVYHPSGQMTYEDAYERILYKEKCGYSLEDQLRDYDDETGKPLYDIVSDENENYFNRLDNPNNQWYSEYKSYFNSDRYNADLDETARKALSSALSKNGYTDTEIADMLARDSSTSGGMSLRAISSYRDGAITNYMSYYNLTHEDKITLQEATQFIDSNFDGNIDNYYYNMTTQYYNDIRGVFDQKIELSKQHVEQQRQDYINHLQFEYYLYTDAGDKKTAAQIKSELESYGEDILYPEEYYGVTLPIIIPGDVTGQGFPLGKISIGFGRYGVYFNYDENTFTGANSLEKLLDFQNPIITFKP